MVSALWPWAMPSRIEAVASRWNAWVLGLVEGSVEEEVEKVELRREVGDCGGEGREVRVEREEVEVVAEGLE